MLHFYKCEVCGKLSLLPTMKVVGYPELSENGNELKRDYEMVCADCSWRLIVDYLNSKEGETKHDFNSD